MIAEDIHHRGTVFKDLDCLFSTNEFNIALSQSRKNSSPSLDQISYAMLFALLTKYKELFLNLFNCFLEKPNNSGFRSVSLLLCAFKIFEKIVYLRLQWLVESQAILPQE